jgi:hypothetical protein
MSKFYFEAAIFWDVKQCRQMLTHVSGEDIAPSSGSNSKLRKQEASNI